jgi:acetylornithine deacetylase/succinyl-diaminopimelate desuccinylase-like protein
MYRHKNEYIDQLKTFISFPGISADSGKMDAVKRCASWLANHLKEIGLQTVEVHKTELHPIIYAEHISHPKLKTILFYGHYDVQPVDPLNAWKYQPFDPVVYDNHIYGRGASDDKGQLFIHVKAIQELLNSKTVMPVNVKCLFEGEEEIGSPHLGNFIRDNRGRLKCDVAVLSDTKMLSVGQPAITYSLRGSLNAEIIIKREGKDLHSGTFGGMINNPSDVISLLLSAMHDEHHTVNIPGFYDDVTEVSEDERMFMKQYGPSDASILNDAGVKNQWGEHGYSNYERTTIRPSVVVSGITSGYQGEGVKNVIPTRASAKINMRLVANQRPGAIAERFVDFVRGRLPAGYSHKIIFSSMVKPVEIFRRHPYLIAAANAYKDVFLKAPVFLRSGGTIPVVGMFKEIMNVPTVLMGFALATDDMHAPNEKFSLSNFFRGIDTSICFMENIGSFSPKARQNVTFKY